MKPTKIATIIGLALTLGACSHPIERNMTRSSLSSSVLLIDAPAGAVLSVEGRQATADSDGKATLAVNDGWHDVAVISDSRTIHSERIFVQDGTQRVIDLQP